MRLVGLHLFAIACCALKAGAIPHLPAEESGFAVVLWHGMGDTCCLPFSMGSIKRTLEAHVEGVYVRSLMIGENEQTDQANGFFMPISEQLDFACNVIKEDPKLKGGFHAIGFSQGGLFLRALIQTCEGISVKNLISIGGPQQGVFGMPRCTEPAFLCDTMRQLLEMGAYLSIVQSRLVQAQYWHDPLHHDEYLKDNIFLPAINNELGTKNATYSGRLSQLENLVLVMFENDTMVIPRESAWFGFYKDGQGKEVETLEDSRLYKEDWLGLQALNEKGKLHKLQSPGNHLQMPKGYFEDNIIPFITSSAVAA
mmetsp:Transcript_12920/g.25741  ORF Transcript_12920/g.25741 Transcript_12920/m.25741 type:complete len:311 (-) Transcript_12920:46-978(-)